MGQWVDSALMGKELTKEVVESLVDFVRSRFEQSPLQEMPPMVFIAAPNPEDKDGFPALCMFVIEDLGSNTKMQTMHRLGGIVAQQGIQIAAIILIVESWLLVRTSPDNIPTSDYSKEPDRQEIISIACMDIAGKMCGVFMHIERNPDNNAIGIGKIERHYPEDGDGSSVDSSLLKSLMKGYVEALHLLAFRIAIDPADPGRLIRQRLDKKTGA